MKNEWLLLHVVDAVGTVHMSGVVRRGEIVDLAGLPSGVYYAAVWSETGSRPVQISHGQFSVLR